jgi:hypothetical protein
MNDTHIPATGAENNVSLFINWLSLYNIGYNSSHHHIIKHKMECSDTDETGIQHCTGRLSSIDTDRLLSIGTNKEYGLRDMVYFMDISSEMITSKPVKGFSI